jgi:exopolysaccharide biosynthesis polyprenyl glycosylphosphotransferase
MGRYNRRLGIISFGDSASNVATRLFNGMAEIRMVESASRSPHSMTPILSKVEDHVLTGEIDTVVLVLPNCAPACFKSLLPALQRHPVEIFLHLEGLNGTRLLQISKVPLKDWDEVLKRVEDIIGATLLLLLLLPLMLMISFFIWLETPGPVFFRQDRFGYNNAVITVLKFRTMYVDKGDPTGAMATRHNDDRVTRVGRIIRKLSLDEIPQLINVLKGDMSLIGPRAHPVAMVAGDQLYHLAVKEYPSRHRVKPGITGWAQVHGLRGPLVSMKAAHDRVNYDLYYIENWSLWLDLKILLLTVCTIWRCENAV